MYQKQNFVKGKKLKAEEMNHIEDGIVAVEKSVKDLEELASAGGIHIGPDAPVAGEQKVWIDTDEGSPDVDDPEEESKPGIDVIAKPGQVIAVKTVGEDSKPTRFKAVDLPIPEKPNWNANEGEKGYIEGRTHYVDAKGIVHKLDNKFIDAEWMATSREYIDPNVFIAEQKLTSGMWQKRQQDIQPGLVYDVHINDVVYPCEAFTEDGGVCIGNNTSLNKNNIPFCIYWAGGSATAGFFYKKSTLAYPIYMKVTGHSWTEYNKLPEEFLPDGVVKSVNGNKPDEKGNVTVEIPESTGGGVDVTASVGQTIIVEEVDASGKPTKCKSADYQPRTHWTDIVEILPETTAEVDAESGAAIFPEIALEDGADYTVIYNGTEYVCTCGGGFLGNAGALGVEGMVDTGEPFVVLMEEGAGVCVPLDGSTSVTLSISGEKTNKIPDIYLPEQAVSTGSAYGSVRTSGARQENDEYVMGGYAFAEGDTTIASGYASHAEGHETTASGSFSHAEGEGTIASGQNSHAEGSGTIASGNWSHAEGYDTKAAGNVSHAEGKSTIARGYASHVQGKYNIEDVANKYAHIVGNGTDDNARSNAHTIDWDGNAWFAGGIELTSPNGTRYRFTVADDGTLSAAVVTE